MKYLVFVAAFLAPSLCFAGPAWVYGKVENVESFSYKIVIRWQSENTEGCSVDDAFFNEETMGGEQQLNRAFALAMAAAASGKTYRLLVDGCTEGKQLARAAQLCVNDDCSYESK